MFPRRLMHVPQAFDKCFLKLTLRRKAYVGLGFSYTAYTVEFFFSFGHFAMFPRRLMHVPQAFDERFF
jgi:hypothetical protein